MVHKASPEAASLALQTLCMVTFRLSNISASALCFGEHLDRGVLVGSSEAGCGRQRQEIQWIFPTVRRVCAAAQEA